VRGWQLCHHATREASDVRKILGTAAAAVAAMLLASGCSASPGPVFGGTRPASAGDFISGMVITHAIYDIMVPDLHNHTSHSVQVTSIRLVSPDRPAVRVLNVTAYPYSRIFGTAFVDEGNLGKDCPHMYVPHPVSDVVIPPHSDTSYYIEITLMLLKPGKYNFGRARISYVTDGRHGSETYYLENIHLRTVPRRTNPHLYDPTNC
jgi:hypothetical protein